MLARTLIESVFPADVIGLSPGSLRQLWEKASEQAKKLGSYNSGGLTSKMWLLPDGQLVSLGQQHWEWLKANPAVAEKFGLSFEGVADDEQSVRLAALARGFIRINYEQRSGTLTVEGMAKFWTARVKDTLFMLVAENNEAIAGMRVHLFSETGQLVRQASAQLFTYEGPEKLEHLPLISESRRGRALRRHAKAVWEGGKRQKDETAEG